MTLTIAPLPTIQAPTTLPVLRISNVFIRWFCCSFKSTLYSMFQMYAVPLEFMYTKFIEHNITQLPSVWTSTCKFCNELDSEDSD
jgi:hypothetical protein